MCGIVGCIGLKKSHQYVIDGLKTLDYRGYDSAGVAFLNERIQIYKAPGSVNHLNSLIPLKKEGRLAIGHTRWATHGKPNQKNSHPHLSNNKQFALVHNGTIENYLDIKNQLLDLGYTFHSDTDSEVVVNLIEHYFKQNNDVLESIRLVMNELHGSYAIVLIHQGENRLYVLKNASPLLIGLGDSFNLTASDASPMIEYTNKFIELEDLEYGYVEKERYALFDINDHQLEKAFVKKEPEMVMHNLNGYDHFMLKEIEEIEPVIIRMINEYHHGDTSTINPSLVEKIKDADHIIFIGCGTSYHASLVGARYFEEMGVPCTCYIASEWAYHPIFPGKNPFIIFISQSGETADLIHCLKIVKQKKYESLVITNVKGSTLERGCTYSMLLHAGVEVSVASTKAYVAQVVALLFLVEAAFNKPNVVNDLYKAIQIISSIREEMKFKVKQIAELIKDKNDVYFLGRGYDYFLSLEASLKLKEISYIHSEALAGGELKHGPIALVDHNTSVIVFITDSSVASNMRVNVEEVKSRGAKVYVFSLKKYAKSEDTLVLDDYPSYLTSVVASSIAFYLAYYTALIKGLNVDKPRNLAKSVTVE